MEYKTSEAQRRAAKRWYADNKEKKSEINKTDNFFNKVRIMAHYSSGIPTCACCGEQNIEFLSIDHINGGGKAHRKITGNGKSFYGWIIRNKFPADLRVLCMNCNFALGHSGYCPHKKEK